MTIDVAQIALDAQALVTLVLNGQHPNELWNTMTVEYLERGESPEEVAQWAEGIMCAHTGMIAGLIHGLHKGDREAGIAWYQAVLAGNGTSGGIAQELADKQAEDPSDGQA